MLWKIDLWLYLKRYVHMKTNNITRENNMNNKIHAFSNFLLNLAWIVSSMNQSMFKPYHLFLSKLNNTLLKDTTNILRCYIKIIKYNMIVELPIVKSNLTFSRFTGKTLCVDYFGCVFVNCFPNSKFIFVWLPKLMILYLVVLYEVMILSSKCRVLLNKEWLYEFALFIII